jgi:hypothetical protein
MNMLIISEIKMYRKMPNFLILLPVTSARNASRADHALAIVPDDAGYNIHGSLIHPNHRRRAADERQTRWMRTRIASAVKESRLIY